ncbi:MAG: arginase, partial [Rhodospirillales bacterium]|nr:arginase [Rhodospirillales bacterium]
RVTITATFCNRLAAQVREAIDAGRVAVSLGGDHSLAIGSIAGAAVSTSKLGCIWVDAHPDANTPESSTSGNIHGMPVAVSLGHGSPELVDVATPGRKIDPANLAILGTSDIDPPEQALIDSEGATMFTIFDFVRHGVARAVDEAIARANDGTIGVHVSFDLDALHADIAPGVGITSDFGLSLREAMFICREIARHCRVISIDIVSLNPVRDLHYQTAHRGIELLLALLGKTHSFNYAAYFDEQHRGMRY